MTDKQIEKMKKYVGLIREFAYRDGEHTQKFFVALADEQHDRGLFQIDSASRYDSAVDYLILRMEREMRRKDEGGFHKPGGNNK